MYIHQVPETAGNFIKLATDGFHRVIEGFMIQGGDATGAGRGPGYTIEDEFAEGLTHDGAGVLSMAKPGRIRVARNSSIALAAPPWLDGKHAIFGKVVDGMDVVREIGKVDHRMDATRTSARCAITLAGERRRASVVQQGGRRASLCRSG